MHVQRSFSVPLHWNIQMISISNIYVYAYFFCVCAQWKHTVLLLTVERNQVRPYACCFSILSHLLRNVNRVQLVVVNNPNFFAVSISLVMCRFRLIRPTFCAPTKEKKTQTTLFGINGTVWCSENDTFAHMHTIWDTCWVQVYMEYLMTLNFTNDSAIITQNSTNKNVLIFKQSNKNYLFRLFIVGKSKQSQNRRNNENENSTIFLMFSHKLFLFNYFFFLGILQIFYIPIDQMCCFLYSPW